MNKKTDFSNISMRDAFFKKLYDIAKKDRRVILISGDMGAPSLDKYRVDLASQYINAGIAEDNMMSVAAGLAREGKIVYTYAIAPFASSHCIEQHKLNIGIMNLPIKIIGNGAGYSYDDSGPTHHTLEDISMMRVIPNLEILNPSDSFLAGKFAELSYHSKNGTYIRLDRGKFPVNYSEKDSFDAGFKELREGVAGCCIVSTGNMVHKAIEINEKLGKHHQLGIVDIYRLKPINTQGLKKMLLKYGNIISLEEHLLDGGLGSILAETILDNDLDVKLKRLGLKKYNYSYGGRENVRKEGGIGTRQILGEIKNFLN